jgi:hypothetical protein
MSYQKILIELMDGITEASTRKEITRAFSAIMTGYMAGKLNDDTLKGVLVEFCMDVLLVKYPYEDVEKLKPIAQDYTSKLYRAIRSASIGERYFTASGIRE